MIKLRLTKTWRVIAIVAVIVLALYIIVYLLLLPRFTAWLRSKYPEASAVQQTLETHYPQKKIEVNDQTFYNETGQHSGERILLVRVIGKSQLEADEKNSVESTICYALGQNSQKYNQIILQSTIEHRFLIFYSRQNESDFFSCRYSKSS